MMAIVHIDDAVAALTAEPGVYNIVDCQTISDRRNTLVHSYWYTDQDGKTVRLKMRAKGRKPYREDEERDDLETKLKLDLDQCRLVFAHLSDLMDEQFPGWTAAEIPAE